MVEASCRESVGVVCRRASEAREIDGEVGACSVIAAVSRGWKQRIRWTFVEGVVIAFRLLRELREAIAPCVKPAPGPHNASVIRGWFRSVDISTIWCGVGGGGAPRICGRA